MTIKPGQEYLLHASENPISVLAESEIAVNVDEAGFRAIPASTWIAVEGGVVVRHQTAPDSGTKVWFGVL